VPPSNKITPGAAKALADGKVELALTFPGPGKVVFKATAKVNSSELARAAAKRAVVVSQLSAGVKKAGKATFKLAPNATAKKIVKAKGKLAAAVTIAFTPTGGSAGTAKKSIVFKSAK
jgi:hypothetical protein